MVQAILFRDNDRVYWASRTACNSRSSREAVERQTSDRGNSPTSDGVYQTTEFSTFFRGKVEKIRIETSSASEPAFE